VEHAARRPDEGPPLPVLVVPRLLPYHDDAGRGVALAEDGLRGPEVERAALAPLRGPRQAREVFPGGKEVLGPRRLLFGRRRRPTAPSAPLRRRVVGLHEVGLFPRRPTDLVLEVRTADGAEAHELDGTPPARRAVDGREHAHVAEPLLARGDGLAGPGDAFREVRSLPA